MSVAGSQNQLLVYSNLLCAVIFCQIPGGTMEDSKVLKGVLINKDVTHPKMRR